MKTNPNLQILHSMQKMIQSLEFENDKYTLLEAISIFKLQEHIKELVNQMHEACS